jgi:two-component system sensor histidine kinase VicK
MLKSGKTNKVSAHELEKFDLADLFFKVINSNRHNFEAKNIKVKAEKLVVPEITADPRRIKALIEILTDNALHYTHEGGEVSISAICKKEDGNIVCSVSNSGIPIRNSDKNRVFDSFYRTEEAKKMNTEGTGLGLFLAKNIVEMHGGKIWVEDFNDSVGVTFIFTLPLN